MEKLLGIRSTGLIRPTRSAPVILPDGEPQSMIWGFRRMFRGKNGGKLARTIVNSREDKLDSPMWRDAFANRRCLIPASAFFEWGQIRGRTAALRFESVEDRWLWIAGIWEEDPERGPCFSMITTEPSEVVAAVHDRMPAVLAEESIGPFLSGGLREFGPSEVPLGFVETENFLRKDPVQGELF
jgi:putative SOS response-associated peptidase YedK